MPLSPLYLEKIEEASRIGEQRGATKAARDFVLRVLNKRIDDLSPEVLAKVMELSLKQLENLYDVALDFTQVSDLTDWLDLNG
jgi:Domain of unknown function (DUF4351)